MHLAEQNQLNLIHKSLTQIFPSDRILSDNASIEENSRTCIPFQKTPHFIVYPITTEEVQATVQIANDFKIPIWTVSTGKNWGYGEKTALYHGGITLVLEKMNKILHVDEELGYAVIEPGVSYKQLNDFLKSKKSKLWSDSAGSTQYASVIGNALDKGRGLTPYADHFGHLCGMNVVLPNGELLETGGGPSGNNKVRHLYKWGVGPYSDGFFTQSNLGIVVQAGVWLMPAPEHSECGVFEFTADMSEFGKFIDDFRNLLFAGDIQSFPHLANDFAMLCILDQYPHNLLTQGEKRLSDHALQIWRKKHGVSQWTFGFGLYGRKKIVSIQKKTLKRVLGRYGRAHFLGAATENSFKGLVIRTLAPIALKLMGKSDAVNESFIPAINLFRGIPTDQFAKQVYFKSELRDKITQLDPPKDKCGFIWIGPVIPLDSTHSMRALEAAKKIYEKYQFEVFIEYIIESPRTSIFLMGVFYDKESDIDNQRALNWYKETREVFLEMGYPPYRVATMCMTECFDKNIPFKNFLHGIKKSVDQNNIMAPGRYGTPLEY